MTVEPLVPTSARVKLKVHVNTRSRASVHAGVRRLILMASSKLNSLRVQTKAKRLGDLKNGGKAWVAILTQRLVQTLAA